MERKIDGKINIYGQIYTWKDRYMERQIERKIDGKINTWKDRYIERQIDGL